MPHGGESTSARAARAVIVTAATAIALIAQRARATDIVTRPDETASHTSPSSFSAESFTLSPAAHFSPAGRASPAASVSVTDFTLQSDIRWIDANTLWRAKDPFGSGSLEFQFLSAPTGALAEPVSFTIICNDSDRATPDVFDGLLKNIIPDHRRAR